MFRSLSQNENRSKDYPYMTSTSSQKFSPNIPFLDLTRVHPNFRPEKYKLQDVEPADNKMHGYSTSPINIPVLDFSKLN